MLNSEIVDTIIRRLGNRRSSPTLREAVVAELRAFISMKEKDMKAVPFFLETYTSLDISGESVSLPADFNKELEEDVVVLTDGQGKYEVSKRIPDVVREVSAVELPARPQIYAIFGRKLYFAAVPDKTYKISFPYGRKSLPFIDNAEPATDWLAEAENAVMLSVQHTFALDILQDNEMASRVEPRMREAWRMFNDYCNDRKNVGLMVSAGDDE